MVTEPTIAYAIFARQRTRRTCRILASPLLTRADIRVSAGINVAKNGQLKFVLTAIKFIWEDFIPLKMHWHIMRKRTLVIMVHLDA